MMVARQKKTIDHAAAAVAGATLGNSIQVKQWPVTEWIGDAAVPKTKRTVPRPGSVACLLLLTAFCFPGHAEESARHAALHSITANELHHYVEVLADDAMEGRLAGSQGGQAAARYIADQLDRIGVEPGGNDGGYFQKFSANYSNILCVLPGSDPILAHEWIMVSAHFDHVGYGTSRTSFGPVGLIHNGADDNASGVSVLLELIEALSRYSQPLRRSVLFAFWDGEEQGLLGSKHWFAHPTVAISNVRLGINLDMVGRLRQGHLIVGGTRSGFGMRQLVSSREIARPLWLDFDWDLRANSDHWSYFERDIPTLFLFTGLHDNYHRPSDDTEWICADGMQEVSRYLFDLVQRAADAETLPPFRPAGRSESQFTKKHREKPLPGLPPRLGVTYREILTQADANSDARQDGSDAGDEVDRIGVRVTEVWHGTPAATAGLVAGDTILAIGETTLEAEGDFIRLLLAAPKQTTLTIRRAEGSEPKQVDVALAGDPIRIGIAWRSDDAEPGTVYLTRVVPDSPAARAGLVVFDRICAVNGESFTGLDGFQDRLSAALETRSGILEFLIETRGQLHDVVVEL